MIIAVDPGNTTGVAVFSGPTPAIAKIEKPDNEWIRSLYHWAARASVQREESVTVVIEDQHPKIKIIGRGKGARAAINLEALKVLIRHATRWAVLAEDFDFDARLVLPSTWQGRMHKTAPSGLTSKKRSKHVVRETWREVVRFWTVPDPDAKRTQRVPSEKIPEDPCDAALIGRWFQLHGGV